MESPIVCGSYVSVIAARLGVMTDEYMATNTIVVNARPLSAQTCISMRIAAKFGDALRWCIFGADGEPHIWQPPEQHDEHPGPDAQPQPPPPPPQRVILRRIPQTGDFMAESIHLTREMHALSLWQSGAMHEWMIEQGIQYRPPPQTVPYVYPGQDQGEDPDEHSEA